MNEIIAAISSIGFPIVACLMLGWYVKYSNDNNQKQIDDLNKRHTEEISKVTEALNNNTIAITRLCERLELEVFNDK